MKEPGTHARAVIDALAKKYGFTPQAVQSMLEAVRAGGGTMAQFDHPGFGGAGQWMRGGMTMVADMFSETLKSRVGALCAELAAYVANEPAPARAAAAAAARWWPAELGATATSAGAQNGMRYAYFAGTRRLAVDQDGRVTVYDTADHRIGGAAQQQSGRGTISFTSQHGPIDLAALRVVSNGAPTRHEPGTDEPAPHATPSAHASVASRHDVLDVLERLAALHAKGVLDDSEFAEKKKELLARL